MAHSCHPFVTQGDDTRQTRHAREPRTNVNYEVDDTLRQFHFVRDEEVAGSNPVIPTELAPESWTGLILGG